MRYHGRYLAARSDADHYENERKREEDEVIQVPDTGIILPLTTF